MSLRVTEDLPRPVSRSTGSPLPPEPRPEAYNLARSLGVTTTFAEVLLQRGYDSSEATRRFLEPRLSHLSQPGEMADRSRAAQRLAQAIRRRERIAVFGDYDCDGITSAAIMTEVLQSFGAEVVTHLASRFDGGYGVSARAVQKIQADAPSLLVTCDCGSSDHESLLALAQAGIETIVIDHHLVPERPLPAVAFLNPHRPDCGFAYKGLASCGLALSIAAALRSELGQALDVRCWLDLVAIGTIADVAPLDGDNRALVRAGLRALTQAARPGIRALLELAGLSSSYPISGQEVAFRLAPRLNAPGRLGPPDLALRLLLAKTEEQAAGLAAEIEQVSAARRAQQEQMLSEAHEEIEREGYASRAALVLGRPGWNHGIVGIVAGRLAEHYQRPVIVVGFDGDQGRGSVRGPAGAELYSALEGVSDVLVRFGGHQAAAGLEVELARLGELRRCFEDVCSSGICGSVSKAASTNAAVLLGSNDEPHRVVQDLGRLEPCGESNPAPRLAVRAELLSARQVRGGHLKLELELETGRRLSAFAVNQGAQASTLRGKVGVVGALGPDRFRGGDAVEIRAEEVHQL